MPSKIVQVNFKLNVPVSDFLNLCDSVAETFANVPGMRWKIWLLNEGETEAGGIYLFETEEAANAYLTGPLFAEVRKMPQLRDISVKTFGVMENVSAITRAPIAVAAAAR